jgi:hypothetical protein
LADFSPVRILRIELFAKAMKSNKSYKRKLSQKNFAQSGFRLREMDLARAVFFLLEIDFR